MAHQLVGVAEIARMLGVSRARVTQLATAYADFPAPEAELASGRVWARTAVESWIRQHPSRPGGRQAEGAAPGPAEGSLFAVLDDGARQAIVLAQQQARLYGYDRIGCEHLLLGLSQLRVGVAARALSSLGANTPALMQAVEAEVPPQKEQSQGHLPFTPEAKRALSLSYREALDLGDANIGTGHMLLGIVSQGNNLALRLLRDHIGTTGDGLRQSVIDVWGTTATVGHEPPAADTPGSDTPIEPPGQHGEDLRSVADRIDHLGQLLDRRLSKIESYLASIAAESMAAAAEPPRRSVPTSPEPSDRSASA